MNLRRTVSALRRPLRWQWLAPTLCSLGLLAAGGRLIQLSMQQHAQSLRLRAQQLAERHTGALERELAALGAEARQLAGLAANVSTGSARSGAVLPAELGSLPAGHGRFWILPDGAVYGATVGDRAASQEIRASWGRALGAGAAASSAGAAAASSVHLIGPEPEGSRWLVAVRAPFYGRPTAAHEVAGATVYATGPPAGWAVAFRPLDPLLAGAGLTRLTNAGFQFALARAGAGNSTGTETFATSAVSPWSSPVTAIVAPAGWQLAVQPRKGWYPTERLVVDVLLLILVTWLAVLGVRDVTRHMAHLRAALATTRRRLQEAQRQLTQEVEVRQNLQRSIDHAQYHDAFTGLPNRHYFLGQLDRALREMRTRAAHRVAVLLIAVDRYRVIIDTLGHTAGDELMVQITRLFEQALAGREHVLARWADDTLVLLLADVPDSPSVLESAHRLQRELQSPIGLRRHRIVVATSIGVSCVESGLQRVEEVLREADIALSGARAQGTSATVIYSAAMQTRLMHLVSLEGDLHAALERREFRLLFQPIVDLRARQIVGMEVLLRWMHPIEGLLRPDRFLSFAEQAGLTVPITRWIIRRACELRHEWEARLPEHRDFYTSINLSPAALLDPGLSDYVAQVLKQTGTPPASLKFELTENGLISNVGAARAALDRLHAMGIELMLDDFGTGYSSLSHLQLFPFDYIKIDGPVQGGLNEQDSSVALVRAMAQMATALGLKAVAETVESPSAAETLRRLGCDFAQGNAFCEPVDAERAFQRLCQRILEPSDEPEEAPELEESAGDSATMILPVLPEPAGI